MTENSAIRSNVIIHPLWCIFWRMLSRFFLVLGLSCCLCAQTTIAADNPKPASAEATHPSNEALAAAKALFKAGKFSDAATAFQSLIGKDPGLAEAHVGLIRSYMHEDEFDAAQAASKKALEAAPSSSLVHATAGDVDFRLGLMAEAESEYKAALKIDSNSARGLYGMGKLYSMLSMHKHAKEAFTKAHLADPADSQIHERWLKTLTYAEQLEELKKTAGDHPTERQSEQMKWLAKAVEKKPWEVAGGIRPAELKMQIYGRTLASVGNSANQMGARAVAKGYGLSVRINDRAGAVLLLDTGAPGITIGHKLAEKAGVVKITDSYFGGVGDQGRIDSYIAWADKINVGGIEFENCIVDVSSRNDIADEAGLIGADVFQKFLVTLDFKNWKLLLAPLPKNPNASANEDEPEDRYIAPEMQSYTKIWRFGHDLVMPVVVSDKAMGNFVLDTGSDINIVNTRLARQITKLSYQGEVIRGVSGRVKEVLNGDKAILQFAKMRVRSDDIPVIDLTHLSNSEGTDIGGLIGIRTLSQMKMSIDYRDGLVNLEVYEFKRAHD